MVNLGIPALYVALVAIGSVVRHAHEREVAAARELVDAHRALASADERARLAREMHDSLGKTLHGIALAAEALPVWVERDPPTAVRYAHGLADAAEPGRGRGPLAPGAAACATSRTGPLAQVLADQCRTWAAETGHRVRVRDARRGRPVDGRPLRGARASSRRPWRTCSATREAGRVSVSLARRCRWDGPDRGRRRRSRVRRARRRCRPAQPLRPDRDARARRAGGRRPLGDLHPGPGHAVVVLDLDPTKEPTGVR